MHLEAVGNALHQIDSVSLVVYPVIIYGIYDEYRYRDNHPPENPLKKRVQLFYLPFPVNDPAYRIPKLIREDNVLIKNPIQLRQEPVLYE